jgi:hypothetical protein
MRFNRFMRTQPSVIFTLAFTSLLTGCATSLTAASGPGFIYTNHFEGVTATANQAGRKRGEACTTNVLGLFTSGDASMSSAMKNGAITVVSSVDHHYKSIFGVYGNMCTIVTGN